VESITICIRTCDDTGALIASWADPNGQGGLTTEANHLRELGANILEAIEVHFDPHEQPKRIFLHFEQVDFAGRVSKRTMKPWLC
jgi:hypothetical protein